MTLEPEQTPSRRMLGATQLAWLEQTLLDAESKGVTWKFLAVSAPIDQLGPIAGALTLSNLPNFGPGSSYTPVSADGGKSWQGGYRAERNALLKYIADHQIVNVVFLSTDDHQNRVNELLYSKTGETGNQATYSKVPYCFEIVAGPLGATGPDLITNHTFAMAQQLAESLSSAQIAAGIEPLGLQGYPGLKAVFRENDPNANVTPSTVDFYSPDTFNYNVLDVSADGKMLTVKSVGVNSTAQNSALESGANGNTARTIFSFQIEASPAASGLHLTRGGNVLNRRTGHVVQQVSVRNDSDVTILGPIYLALDDLASGVNLTVGFGRTSSNAPLGSPYIKISNTDLAAGGTANVALEFTLPPAEGGISYGPRLITGSMNP